MVRNSFEELVSLPVELRAVSVDGKLMVKIADEIKSLAVGESWRRVVDVEVNNAEWDGTYHITSTLYNYGWLDLSQIQPP